MGKVQRYRNVVSAFISSEQGQRFFNFAYSIGAAIVIWGALFKILHLPGGNALLSIGMGTEVLMSLLLTVRQKNTNGNKSSRFLKPKKRKTAPTSNRAAV